MSRLAIAAEVSPIPPAVANGTINHMRVPSVRSAIDLRLHRLRAMADWKAVTGITATETSLSQISHHRLAWGRWPEIQWSGRLPARKPRARIDDDAGPSADATEVRSRRELDD